MRLPRHDERDRDRAVTTSVSDKEGRVTIDFNRAVNFPFAFSDFGTCPARSRATGCRSR